MAGLERWNNSDEGHLIFGLKTEDLQDKDRPYVLNWGRGMGKMWVFNKCTRAYFGIALWEISDPLCLEHWD